MNLTTAMNQTDSVCPSPLAPSISVFFLFLPDNFLLIYINQTIFYSIGTIAHVTKSKSVKTCLSQDTVPNKFALFSNTFAAFTRIEQYHLQISLTKYQDIQLIQSMFCDYQRRIQKSKLEKKTPINLKTFNSLFPFILSLLKLLLHLVFKNVIHVYNAYKLSCVYVVYIKYHTCI